MAIINRIRNWWRVTPQEREYLRLRQLEREWRNNAIVISDKVGLGKIGKP